MKSVNYEVKGQLAKLLATEDLIIENRQVSTASFDVDRRILTLPMWQRASNVVYDLLVGHEVGHALYTPNIDWKKDHPNIPRSFVNIIEDVRIERLIKRRFAGLNKTFYRGYSELSDQDFFGIEEENLEDLSLADRINLQFKIGNFVQIPFADSESHFLDLCRKVETFSDVLLVAQELYDFCKSEVNEQEPQESPDGTQQTGGQSPQSSSGGGDASESMSDGSEEESSSGDLETQGQKTTPNKQGGDQFDTVTDKSFEDAVEELNTGMHSFAENVYLELPTVTLDTVIAKNTDVHDHINECQQLFEPFVYGSIDNEYRKFKKSAQKEVNYLVKEFECKKAADSYARASISRTGVLDCTKLHTYKYNEDLFRKVTTLPEGKNHGLVFVLDWSGSMQDVLVDTIKQLYNLIWFCKKVSVPFDVYAFTNEWNVVTYDSNRLDSMGHPTAVIPPEHQERKHNELYVDRSFSLMNLFTSTTRGAALEDQMRNLYRVVAGHDSSHRWNTQYQNPRRLSLSGTPLNEALICMNQIIPDFKKRNGVQKVQCIVLTDGEAPPMKYNVVLPHSRNPEETYTGTRPVYSRKCFLRDRSTGNTHMIKDDYHGPTETLLDQLRSRFVNTNFIGIRVLASRDSGNFIRRYTESVIETDKLLQHWKKNKTVTIKGSGYHSYFGLSSTALSQDSDFHVSDEATKSQIKSAFLKSLKSKKMNKRILGEFIELIA